jgi:hypothetical protein
MHVIGFAFRESAPGLAILLRVTSAPAMVAAGYLRAGTDEFGRPRRSV